MFLLFLSKFPIQNYAQNKLNNVDSLTRSENLANKLTSPAILLCAGSLVSPSLLLNSVKRLKTALETGLLLIIFPELIILKGNR